MPSEFETKIEGTLRGVIGLLASYVYTLSCMTFLLGRKYRERSPRFTGPTTYLSVSAFIAIAVFQFWNRTTGSSMLQVFSQELSGLSTTAVVLRTLPIAIFALVWAQGASLLARWSPRVSDSLVHLPLYVAGTQFSLFSLTWLAGSFFQTYGFDNLGSALAFPGLPVLLLWPIVPALFALFSDWHGDLTYPALASAIAISCLFVLTVPLVAYEAAVLPGQLEQRDQAEDARLAGLRSLRSTAFEFTKNPGNTISYKLWLRNDTTNHYLIYRTDARIAFGPFAALQETRLDVNGWSAREWPILSLKPGEIGWIQVTTRAGFLVPRSLKLKTLFFSVFRADSLTASGDMVHGEVGSNAVCLLVSRGSVQPCDAHLPTWQLPWQLPW